jgi:hypothetical protein
MHSIICSFRWFIFLKHVILVFCKIVLHALFSYRCHPHITAWILAQRPSTIRGFLNHLNSYSISFFTFIVHTVAWIQLIILIL